MNVYTSKVNRTGHQVFTEHFITWTLIASCIEREYVCLYACIPVDHFRANHKSIHTTYHIVYFHTTVDISLCLVSTFLSISNFIFNRITPAAFLLQDLPIYTSYIIYPDKTYVELNQNFVPTFSIYFQFSLKAVQLLENHYTVHHEQVFGYYQVFYLHSNWILEL